MTRMMMLSAAAAIALAGAGSYALTRPADAQDAPAAATPDRAHDWKSGDGHHGWGMRAHFMHHLRMEAHQGWGLFAPAADKNLTPADVQTIAEAILLRHGNHSWKVANVAPNQDNTVSFAYTTADGGVVARFAVDTQTGRIRRIG
jgi:hypothetical protein